MKFSQSLVQYCLLMFSLSSHFFKFRLKEKRDHIWMIMLRLHRYSLQEIVSYLIYNNFKQNFRFKNKTIPNQSFIENYMHYTFSKCTSRVPTPFVLFPEFGLCLLFFLTRSFGSSFSPLLLNCPGLP